MSIIGVEWNQGTDTWTRIDVDGDVIGAPTFDSESPWGDIVRCTLNTDGSENEVSANGKGDDITLDGSTGRVMVRIPKFWIKSDSPGANVYRWWISDATYDGFVVHPAFYQRGNTDAPADYIYVGAYEAGYASPRLESQTGDTVLVSANIFTFRTRAEAVGSTTRWGITSVWARSAYMLLYYIEYADADSQSTIGKGVSSSSRHTTGADGIDANLATNGTGAGTGADGQTPIAYRGMENLWGNVNQFIDGYDAIDAEYRLIKRDGSGTFRNPLQAGDYEASAAAPVTSNGYIKNIVWEDLLSLQFIGSDTTGGNYLYDYFYAHDAGEVNILLAGGHWDRGVWAGIAYLYSSSVASSSGADFGGRLEFIPEAAVGAETHYGIVVLSGVGTLAGISHVTFIGKSTLSGSGTLAAIGVRLRTGLATLSGSGALSAIGGLLKTAQATLSGIGSLSAIGRRVYAGAATLSGSGLLTGKGVLTVIGKATLSGVGSLAVIGATQVVLYGKAVFSGAGTLTAKGVGIFTGATTLTGSGALVVNGVKTAIGKVTLAGTGALAIVGGRIRTGAVTLAGVGTLATVGSLIKTGIATLTGNGTLAANAVMTYGGKATLSGIGTLTAILSRVVLVFEGRKLVGFVGRTLSGFTGRDLSDDNDEQRRIM